MVWFLLLLLFSGLTATPGWAETNTATVTGADKLVVRRGPGKQFPPFASLTEGSKVEVEEIRGEWARIVTGSGLRGYVHSNFLSISGTVEPEGAAGAATTDTAEPEHAEATPTRPTERARAADTELRAATDRKKSLEGELRTATERVKTLEGELAAASERSKALEGEAARLRERSKTLESDLQATQQQLSQLRAHPVGTPGSATTAAGELTELRTQIGQLTTAIHSLQDRLGTAGEHPLGSGALADSTGPGEALSGTTILLTLFGVVVGWVLNGAFGRKQDRSRRPRIRF